MRHGHRERRKAALWACPSSFDGPLLQRTALSSAPLAAESWVQQAAPGSATGGLRLAPSCFRVPFPRPSRGQRVFGHPRDRGARRSERLPSLAPEPCSFRATSVGQLGAARRAGRLAAVLLPSFTPLGADSGRAFSWLSRPIACSIRVLALRGAPGRALGVRGRLFCLLGPTTSWRTSWTLQRAIAAPLRRGRTLGQGRPSDSRTAATCSAWTTSILPATTAPEDRQADRGDPGLGGGSHDLDGLDDRWQLRQVAGDKVVGGDAGPAVDGGVLGELGGLGEDALQAEPGGLGRDRALLGEVRGHPSVPEQPGGAGLGGVVVSLEPRRGPQVTNLPRLYLTPQAA